MAYVAGLYTGASKAAADEAQRFRQFQTQIDEMSARERAGMYRRDQAAMDQFTAGLKPQSSVAVPDLALPSAPPMPDALLPKTGGGADSGAAAQANYERDRALEQRKMLANQYNSEVGAFNSLLTDLGKQKYILEQQLSVAPAYQQQAIRDQLSSIEKEINTTMKSGRERVQTIGDLIKTIDENVRLGDYNRGRRMATTGVQSLDQAKPLPGRNAPLGVPEGSAPIPMLDSLGMPPDYEAEYAAGAASRAGLAGLPPYVVDTPRTTVRDSWIGKETVTYSRRGEPITVNTVPAKGATTDYRRDQAVNNAERNFSRALQAVRQEWNNGGYNNLKPDTLGFAYGYVADVGEDIERRAESKKIAEWLGSDAAEQLFRTNKRAFELAIKDPATAYTQYASATTAPAAGPTPVADAVAADALAGQTTAGGKTDRPGVAPPQTPEGEVAANPPLAMTEDVALDTTDPRLAQITQYSAQSVATRAAELPAKVSAAVSSDVGQAIIKRARELGVDPAAAIAIYGIESSFGAKSGKSGAGASGIMQVTPAQRQNIINFYTGQGNQKGSIAQYGIPPELTALVQQSVAAGGLSDIDAGLLQLKMAELIGLDKNLWGAGYQSDMWQVKKAGRPLARHDAGDDPNKIIGVTNSDYNKLYVTLYNEVRSYVNVPPGTEARGTGQSLEITELDNQQSVVEQNYQRTAANTERTYQRLVQQREAAMQNLNRAREFNQAADMQKYADEVTNIDSQISGLNDTLYEAHTTARIAVDALNIQRVKAQISNAVSSLRNGRPELFAKIYTTVSGMDLDIREMSDGKTYAVYYNGELVSGKGVTAAEIEKAYRPDIDSAFAATEATAVEAAKKLQGDLWLKKLEIQGNITLKELEINGKLLEMQQSGELSNPQRKEDENGNLIGLYFTDKQRNIIEFRTGTPGTTPQGLPTTGNVEVLVHPSRKQ